MKSLVLKYYVCIIFVYSNQNIIRGPVTLQHSKIETPLRSVDNTMEISTTLKL